MFILRLQTTEINTKYLKPYYKKSFSALMLPGEYCPSLRSRGGGGGGGWG